MSHPPHSPDPASLLRLLEVVRHLAGPFELNDLLQRVIDAGREVLCADRGSVFLYDAAREELFTAVATGGHEIRFSIKQGIAGEAARTRQIVSVPDCYADPRFNPEIDRRTGYRTRSLITVPLIGLEDALVGVLQLLNPAKGRFDANDEPIAHALAGQAAVAIQRARLLEERTIKLKMERDLALAREIQTSALPAILPSVPGYDLAAFSRPADQTGGDIYDVIGVEEPAGADGAPVDILLADATGHGVGPALSVTQVRAMYRIGLALGGPLDELVSQINRRIFADMAGARFVTAIFGRLEPAPGLLHYQAPGQGPLLHIHAGAAGQDPSFEWLPASSPPLGVLPDMTFERPEPMRIAPGDAVVLLTDGFYEGKNAGGQDFGRAGVERVFRANLGRPATQILDALVQALDAFSGGAPQSDDLTALLMVRSA